jgi:HEPN domain-containing protein
MTQNEKVQYWIDISENDMKAAEIMFNGEQYLYTCFMCQQAIEKIFKGYFVKHKEEQHPHIHNLITLAERSNISEMLSEEQNALVEILNPFNIEARYPDYKNKMAKSLTKDITQDILRKTKELQKWTKEKILSQ